MREISMGLGEKQPEKTPEEIETIRRHVEFRTFNNLVIGHADQLSLLLRGETTPLRNKTVLLIKGVIFHDGYRFKLTPRAIGVLNRFNYEQEQIRRLK
jgi:hypothetical protein